MATVKQILKKSYQAESHKLSDEEFLAILKKDTYTLVSAANKRLKRMKQWETQYGVESPVISYYQDHNKFDRDMKFSARGLDNKEDLMNEITKLRRFLRSETTTKKGFYDVMFTQKKEELAKIYNVGTKDKVNRVLTSSEEKLIKSMSGEITDDFIREYWRSFNKIKETAQLSRGVFNWTHEESERFVKMLFEEASNYGNKNVNWDNVIQKANDVIVQKEQEVLEKYNLESEQIYEQTKQKGGPTSPYSGGFI